MKKSPFKMGWLMVMFDLPVVEPDDRKAATRFRQNLLDDGYLMVQFSVYARPCVSLEKLDKHLKRLKKFVPCAGNVRSLFLTDQQWGKSAVFSGPDRPPRKHETSLDLPKQVEFW